MSTHAPGVHSSGLTPPRNIGWRISATTYLARVAEAEREGWAGEAEGLKVSLAAANNKLAQIELSLARRAEAVSLGMPAYRDTAAATLSAGDRHDY